MAVSKDYLDTLKGLAQARYQADVAVAEGEFKRRAGGTVTGTGAQMSYKSPAQIAAEGGTPQYGELDIAYERNREGLEGGLESRGILRSGQAATTRGRMASDYQQAVLDYYNAMNQRKGALGASLAFDIADLEAKYGTAPQAVAPERKEPASQEPTSVPITTLPGLDMSNQGGFVGMVGGPTDRAIPAPTPASRPATPPKPAAAPKPATPPKPAAPKPAPKPSPAPKPAPKPAPTPVKRPTPVRMR